MVGEHPHLHRRSAQRDAPRHLAVAPRGLRDHGGRDPDVGVLRHLPVGPRPRARSPGAVDLPERLSLMTDVATKNWYIVHTYSGFEKKVAESLGQRVQAYGLQNEIGEILIPTEDVVEMRSGRKVVTPRSEERRVGKECRSRWSPYHSNKKEEREK